jgi:hypothetical protein
MNLKRVNEDFVQFVWKFSLFSKENLILPTGERIQIVYPGTQNFNGGPDFFNAKIYIGETLWVGNVEIHLSIKDWHQHQHALDAAYNNIILHVVYAEENEPIKLQNKRHVPSLSICKYIYPKTLEKYEQLQSHESLFIPCQRLIIQVEPFTYTEFYETLLFERLERKVLDIENDLRFVQGDMDAAFNLNLFKYFGAPLNKGNFELLARSFTRSQLHKQQVSIIQLESFLFGLADLLQGQDPYALSLQAEFDYTKSLFKLQNYCKGSQWHFAGVRPQNFPTIRIAQLAALLFKNPRMFTQIIEESSLKTIKNKFELEVSAYWTSHYSFNKVSKASSKRLSSSFIDKLLINLIVPMLFFYGKYIGEERYIERAVRFLNETKAEQNQLIKGFKALSAPCANAFDSQALIELKNSYCIPKKCLSCRIGYQLLKQ